MIKFSILIMTSFFFTSPVVHADILSITDPAYTIPNSPDGVLRPVRGMSMNHVKEAFGEPTKILPPVGQPPITRWLYKNFEVYFESNTVIHSVVAR